MAVNVLAQHEQGSVFKEKGLIVYTRCSRSSAATSPLVKLADVAKPFADQCGNVRIVEAVVRDLPGLAVLH